MKDIRGVAESLFETWVNGNISTAKTGLRELTPMQAAGVIAVIADEYRSAERDRFLHRVAVWASED